MILKYDLGNGGWALAQIVDDSINYLCGYT